MGINCEFERTSETTLVCIKCHRTLEHTAPGVVYRNCIVGIQEMQMPHLASPQCDYRGEFFKVGKCDLCGGEKGSPFEIFRCEIHGECSVYKLHSGVKSCASCEDRSDLGVVRSNKFELELWRQESMRQSVKWVYGITTVKSRLNTLFPRTLESLAHAGFDKPRLFVDGAVDTKDYDHFGLEVTIRNPPLRTFGNWALSLAELYIREPHAERYAIFQDDFVTYTNLRDYLDYCSYPNHGYWNLYTFPNNHKPEHKGWYPSNQRGLGAVALVFNRDAVTTLLSSNYFVMRPQDRHRGWRNVDGGIVSALKKEGWKEYVHNPSLVQHTGLESSMGNKRNPLAPAFLGETFNARQFISQIPQQNPEPVAASLNLNGSRPELRDAVISAMEKAELMMTDVGVDDFTRDLVRRYVNRGQPKGIRPRISERFRTILDREEVRNWIAAEKAYTSKK